MCDAKLFKTPRRHHAKPYDRSDSEQSNTESDYTDSGRSASSSDLSIVAVFDDLMRLLEQKRCDRIEDAFQEFTIQAMGMWESWKTADKECQRLREVLDNKQQECCDLTKRLNIARNLLDVEKRNTRVVEQERDRYYMQLDSVKAMLLGDNRNKLHDETREKIAGINRNGYSDGNVPTGQLSAIPEINSTGSILSDLSYSRSEDDLDSSRCCKQQPWTKHRPSFGGDLEPVPKKRRSSSSKVVEIGPQDTVRATTTLTIGKDGPITATSIIESVPDGPSGCAPPSNLVFESWARETASPRKPERSTLRQHSFQQKTMVLRDVCGACEKRFKFGRSALKCKECRAFCHPECKDLLPLPCIPAANTPNHRNLLGIISDYTPTTPPMVPSLIVHCTNEIEARGLSEMGIYRVPGSEKDVKALKERFLRGRGAPCLNDIDIHVICGTVKDFLRSLTEPITTCALYNDIVNAVEDKDPSEIPNNLYKVIGQLPQPNRDTLAYMILHLQRVAVSKECKMPVSNLAKVFAPTIVGYASNEPDPATFLMDVRRQIHVMEELMNLPSDFWSAFIQVNDIQQTTRLQQTPSTDSLLQPTTTRGLFTPSGAPLVRKRQKFFATPPTMK